MKFYRIIRLQVSGIYEYSVQWSKHSVDVHIDKSYIDSVDRVEIKQVFVALFIGLLIAF